MTTEPAFSGYELPEKAQDDVALLPLKDHEMKFVLEHVKKCLNIHQDDNASAMAALRFITQTEPVAVDVEALRMPIKHSIFEKDNLRACGWNSCLDMLVSRNLLKGGVNSA